MHSWRACGHSPDGQANTRTRVFRLAVKALEHFKYLGMKPGVDANTVVGYREHPLAVTSDGGKMNDRCAIAAVLDAIANQIEQQLHQLRAVSHDAGQLARRNLRRAAPNRRIQQTNDFIGHLGAIDYRERSDFRIHTGIGQQVLRQLLDIGGRELGYGDTYHSINQLTPSA